MIRFLRKLMGNEVFARPETLQAMGSTWRQFGFPLDRAALRAPSWPIAYGLGIMRFQLPRLLTPRAPMPTLLGHSGSTGCWLFSVPTQDLFLAGTVEEATAGAVPYRMLPKLVRLLA
jgi:D-alanyl-D-alanine carboxypeptidase